MLIYYPPRSQLFQLKATCTDILKYANAIVCYVLKHTKLTYLTRIYFTNNGLRNFSYLQINIQLLNELYAILNVLRRIT